MTDVWVEREEEFCDDAPGLRAESPWSLDPSHISREICDVNVAGGISS